MKPLSEKALKALETLGNFSPTNNNPKDKLVKGYFMEEGSTYKVYLTPEDLIEFSEGLKEAADYLDERAKS